MPDDWARPVVHWDIQAQDPERIRDFYTQMFNWDIQGASPIMEVPAGIGGPDPSGFFGHIVKAERAGITLYIQVRDLNESLERAPALGGSVISPPFQIPGGATIAGISDPEGNRVVLVQQ